jgi:hypothetical protein
MHDDFETAFEQGEVSSRLIGSTQRQDVFVWQAHVLPESVDQSLRPIYEMGSLTNQVQLAASAK